MDTHAKPHRCGFSNCGRAFALRTDLRRHTAKHSKTTPKFLCKHPGCPFPGATRRDNLLKHMKKSHASEIIESQYQAAITAQKDAAQTSRFLSAVETGNLDAVASLLKRYHGKLTIGSRTESGKSAVHLAAEYGHVQMLQLLLKQGCRTDTSDLLGNFPLHGSQSVAVAEILQQHGMVDVNCQNQLGRTPLSYAAERGFFNLCEYLLQGGASMILEDSSEKLPHFYAAGNGHMHVVRLLLENGCSSDISYREKQLCLRHASSKGHLECVKLLMQWNVESYSATTRDIGPP